MVDNYADVQVGDEPDLALPAGGLEEGDVEQSSMKTPPYMTYRTFTSLLARLKEHGVPQVFDASFFNKQSGSMAAQIRAGLKAMGFIDDEHRPTPKLHQIVEADEAERKRILKRLAEEFYADALALGTGATFKQLQDVIRSRGLKSPDTVQKAINFYLSLADDVGLEVSTYFKTHRPSTSNGTRRPRKKTLGPKAAEPAPHPVTPPVAVSHAVKTPEVQKAEYVDMLMRLVAERSAEAGTPLESALLDRIEKALGFSEPRPKSEGGESLP